MNAMPNLTINIQQQSDSCQIKPMALMNIFLHAHRFWTMNDSKSEFAYGILVGKSNGMTRIIEKAIPILHSERSEVVFDEPFYKHWDDLNKLEEELESGQYNMGWYKIIEMTPMKFRARDIRNQVRIQTENPDAIALLLDPESFLNEEGYGFSIFKLTKDETGHFHEMCEYTKIPWEIMELGSDVDKTVMTVVDLIDKYNTDKPYVEELDESEVPDAGGYDWDSNDGYVTPDFDPNQPGFY